MAIADFTEDDEDLLDVVADLPPALSVGKTVEMIVAIFEEGGIKQN